MNLVEAAAALLVVVNVALVAGRSVWNYPFAILAVAIYAAVFAHARLYSDMLLQAFFLVVNIYGWINWARAKAEAGEVTVAALAPAARTATLAVCAAATLGWGGLMHRYTDAAYPWWDAGVAIVSVAAQWLQARRAIESWWLWIVVDLASIPLYAAKQLWFTTGLYAILLLLSVIGLVDWTRARARRSGRAA